MALNKTKKEHLADLYTISQKHPDLRTRVMVKLEEYNITVDEFNEYDRFMVSQNVVEAPSIVDEYPDIEAFDQSDLYSKTRILEIFEDRDSLQNVLDEIGSPPTDAEWFQAGKTAEQRISELRPFYETRKAEDWGNLESALPAPFAPLMGPIGFLTELIGGGIDLRHDFKEDLHERGAVTSWNPFTGFGAWDIAEFRQNPLTGQSGFTPELLAMEEELDKLYGENRIFMEQVEEGGSAEALPGSQTMTELDRLNTMINEEQLLDPRMFGEAQ